MLDLLQNAFAGISLLPVLGALAAIAQLWLVGRLLVGTQLPDLITFGAGWGAAVLAMTVLGTMGDGSLVLLPYLIWGLAALALGLEIRARRVPAGWMSLVLVLPLALLISGRIASEWDEFSHWLHAFRYLDAFATLPGKGRPAIESCCAAYPYGWPLLGWLSSRLIGFSEAVPGLLNLFQLALCGELLARILAEDDKPGWGHHAWGALLVTALGTTFVPKLVFTAYADVPTSAMVLAGLWLGWRLAEQPGWRLALALGLCCAALVTQKPSNLVLVVLVLGSTFVLMFRSWRLPAADTLLKLAAAMLPGLAAWWLWRHFVAANLAGEEMALRPLSQWHFDILGVVALGMADVASNKGGYFGTMLTACAVAIFGLMRPLGESGRLVRAVALVFAGYNAFLLLAYIAIFIKGEGERVASYWRYNTHLGLLTALLIAVFAVWASRRWPQPRLRRPATILAVMLIVVAPLAGIRHIRFDLEPAKVFLRATLQQVNGMNLDEVALIDAKGSGLSHVMASYEWDGSPDLSVYTTGFDDFTPDRYLSRVGNARHLLVVSWNDAVAQAFPALPRGPQAVLAERESGKMLAVFPYPGGGEPRVFP